MVKAKIIAEIANAHQGNINNLKQIICEAAKAGADAVKFQWFKYDQLATPDYEWYDAYLDLFIDESSWGDAIILAAQNNLEVWIDIFDKWGLELAKKYHQYITGFKVPSTVLQSKLLINEIANFKKPILIGIGGWYDNEIEELLKFVTGFTSVPIILMYGFQGYPTNEKDVNLARLTYLKEKYTYTIGFADHTDGDKPAAMDIPVYAYFAGASVIEKHITLDRSLKGYDYYSSLEPNEFQEMVEKIRLAEIVNGNTIVNESQRKYLKDSIRVVANQEILQGEVITLDKIAYKRTKNIEGYMPSEFEKNLPLLSKVNIAKNESISATVVTEPKVTIAVVARLKSTRLKKKALLPINGVESIKRCLLNCLAAEKADHVVLATSYLEDDAPLANFDLNGRVQVIKGDPENVAYRILEAAKTTEANIVLRVTGDCPAVSPEIIDYLIDQHLQHGADLTLATSNHAIGTGADVYSVHALNKLVELGHTLDYTEYLSFYFVNNPHLFRVNKVELPDEFKFPHWRLTLDEQKDYEMFVELYKGLNVGVEPLQFSRIREYLINNPSVVQINNAVSLKWKDNSKVHEEINIATSFK